MTAAASNPMAISCNELWQHYCTMLHKYVTVKPESEKKKKTKEGVGDGGREILIIDCVPGKKEEGRDAAREDDACAACRKRMHTGTQDCLRSMKFLSNFSGLVANSDGLR